MSEKECPKCYADVGIGLFLKICNDTLSHKINCKELREKFEKGEVSREELVGKIKGAAKDEPDLLDSLNEVERIMKTGRLEDEK